MKTYSRTLPRPSSSLPPMGQDTAALPPAFWQLIEIGERAGLITPINELGMAASDAMLARMRASVGRMLAELRYSPTEFYLLVTLFKSAPHSLSMETLARDTLTESESLGVALDRLYAERAIAAESGEDPEAPVTITPSGKSLILLLMYRAFRSGFPAIRLYPGRASISSEHHRATQSL